MSERGCGLRDRHYWVQSKKMQLSIGIHVRVLGRFDWCVVKGSQKTSIDVDRLTAFEHG